MQFQKYEGTGNDFIMIDDRKENFPANNYELVARLCHRRFGIGADGLILIRNFPTADFNMLYYNADGLPGSMCGNGGRCAAAFAHSLGICSKEVTFNAFDGLHFATIGLKTVRLRMASLPLSSVSLVEGGFYVNTGSPHYVKILDELPSDYPVYENGKKLRYSDAFVEFGGTNVNFVCGLGNKLQIRTYERGVEAETLSCGTGAVAAALVYFQKSGFKEIELETLGGTLWVSFNTYNDYYSNIILEGPARSIFSGTFQLAPAPLQFDFGQ